MYKIACIFGNVPVYWDSIVMVLAELTGILLFFAAYLRKEEKVFGADIACPVSIMLSLILSRVAHWFFRPDSYGSFAMAMTDFFGPGHALMGAFAGCFLAACLLRLIGTIESLPRMLDCMSFGGCAAIALGRLSNLFTPDDRGTILQGIESFPWTYPAVNPTSGALEYRFATFLFQAITAGCIFAVLMALLYNRNKKFKCRDGDMTLLFLLMYCASQIVWDSTRYDTLRLRSNGFISAVQLACALTLMAVLVILSIRAGAVYKTTQILRWFLIALAFGGAGGMEYLAQIRGDRAALAHGIMGGCMAVAVAVGFAMCRQIQEGSGNKSAPKYKGKYSGKYS